MDDLREFSKGISYKWSREGIKKYKVGFGIPRASSGWVSLPPGTAGSRRGTRRQGEWCGKGHLTEAFSLCKWSVPSKPTGNQENSFPKCAVLSQNPCWYHSLPYSNKQKAEGRKMVTFIPVTGAGIGRSVKLTWSSKQKITSKSQSLSFLNVHFGPLSRQEIYSSN